MDDPQALWAIVLLAVALLLVFAEVLVPSGGVLGFLAAICLIGGVVLMFRVDTTLGLVSAIIAVIALPFVLGFAMKIWPNTPIGRRLILQSTQRDANPDSDAAPDTDDLVGAAGKSLTELRPVGTCLINGRRLDCLADAGVIEPDQPVRVISVDGMQIKVRVDDTV
jgi:membrane-bound ClpP family serine protease